MAFAREDGERETPSGAMRASWRSTEASRQIINMHCQRYLSITLSSLFTKQTVYMAIKKNHRGFATAGKHLHAQRLRSAEGKL